MLYTSGSTGVPKEAGRRLVNIEHELTALEAVFGASLGAGRVFATVSHRHVYGLLFRILWPLLERRPFATFDLEYPEQLLGAIGSGNVLISSPAMLKRIGHLPARSAQWRAVFSSGGFLPADAAADVTRVLGAEADRGSRQHGNERRGVAHARRARVFGLLPSVEVRAAAEDLLEVRSPFAGDDGWQALGIASAGAPTAPSSCSAAPTASRRSRTSASRCRRSSAGLLEHAFVKDAVAVALEDSARQYIGVVVELTRAGREALAAQGKARRELRAALVVARPSRCGRVAARCSATRRRMPVDAQGKRQVAALVELFGAKS